MIIRKNPEEIERMAAAGRVVADTIALLGEHIRPGVTTGELDKLAADYIASQGGTSPFYGYRGYPATICTSCPAAGTSCNGTRPRPFTALPDRFSKARARPSPRGRKPRPRSARKGGTHLTWRCPPLPSFASGRIATTPF